MLDNAERQAPETSHQHGLADALREVKEVWSSVEEDARYWRCKADQYEEERDAAQEELTKMKARLNELTQP